MEMEFTDTELVVMQAMIQIDEKGALVAISEIIEALSMPRFAVKKLLIGLVEKGVLCFHRHVLIAAVSRQDRKMMISQKVTILGETNWYYFHGVAFRM